MNEFTSSSNSEYLKNPFKIVSVVLRTSFTYGIEEGKAATILPGLTVQGLLIDNCLKNLYCFSLY